MKPHRINILDVPVDCLTMPQALACVDDIIAGGWGGQEPELVIAVNPEKVVSVRRERGLLPVLSQAGLLIPDGAGLVFGARLLGARGIERVAGSDLMQAICERATARGYRLFLFGAAPDVNQRAVDVLRRRHPGIQIVGHEHGYVAEAHMPDLIERINRSRADVLFVALGSPRQERWMARYRHQLRVKLCQGVGGTFDILAGRVKRAPRSFRMIHLEWFYRLLVQPSRILRQTALAQFALWVLWKRVIG